MKQFLILLWILWFQMLWVFTLSSIYLVRIGNWLAAITVPCLLLVLVAGWKLSLKSRQEWQRSDG